MKAFTCISLIALATLSFGINAGTIQTLGTGSAVTNADRLATFDVLGTFAQPPTLLNYTEDQIIVSVDDTHHVFAGVHYGISGNNSFVTIAAADGIDFFGVEALIFSGHQLGGTLVWQALNNGNETGSGTLVGIDGYNNITNAVFGWSDASGFDELRLAVVFSGPPEFGSLQAIALDNVKMQAYTAVPLPASLPLFLIGIIGLALSRWRKSRTCPKW